MKAVNRDFVREMSNTKTRFLSIFLIVALGVAIFSGLGCTKTDMNLTADKYYDETDFYDIRIISTMGLTDGDIAAVKEIDGIENAEGGIYTDLVYSGENSQGVVRIKSEGVDINKYVLVSGNRPKAYDECLADEGFMRIYGYEIGDVITFSKADNADISDKINTVSLKITGTAKLSEYLENSRGSTTLLNGVVNYFFIAKKELFAADCYSELYVTVKGAKDLDTYSDEYEEFIDAKKELLEAIEEQRCEIRLSEVLKEPYEELDKAYNEYNEKYQEFEDKRKETYDSLDAAKLEIEDAEKVYKSGIEELDKSREALYAAGYSKEAADMFLAEQQIQLEEAKKSIDSAKLEYESSYNKAVDEFDNAKKELEDAYKELTDAKAKLDDTLPPEWYVLTRNANESFVSFGQDAERIDAIGKVFPVIFFLVAILVTLTTMTRMVDEQRIQIGTLKALGYSKNRIASKYINYALLASVTGSIFGALIGEKLFPYIIIISYKLMYKNLQGVFVPYNVLNIIISAAIATVCTTGAAYLACINELRANPAVLMRPAAPRKGRRIFIERIGFIWNRMNFTMKSTMRNLFRYKKRFFMTIFGIAGCMALLLVGYGIKDSIGIVSTRQYSDIWKYDASLTVDSHMSDEEKEEFLEKLKSDERIDSAVYVCNVSHELVAGDVTKTADILVLSDDTLYDKYFTFKSRTKNDIYHLTDDGVILTEKLANILKVSEGDNIEIVTDGVTRVAVKVTAVTENYLYHKVYMTNALYNKIFGENCTFTECYYIAGGLNDTEQNKLAADILSSNEIVKSLTLTIRLCEIIDDMLNNLDIIVYVLIVCAGLLSFVVLYNLNNINITERKRELATLKVLGFYPKEIEAYVYRENVFLTIIGMAAGIVLGIVLHRFIIITCEIDILMFGRNINFNSFVYSMILTVLFSIFVCFITSFSLKKIDMAQSLKSIE